MMNGYSVPATYGPTLICSDGNEFAQTDQHYDLMEPAMINLNFDVKYFDINHLCKVQNKANSHCVKLWI